MKVMREEQGLLTTLTFGFNCKVNAKKKPANEKEKPQTGEKVE